MAITTPADSNISLRNNFLKVFNVGNVTFNRYENSPRKGNSRPLVRTNTD
ncbi:hypothetical protein PBCVCVM1_719R [Paramecium bursaria Chlorella virus CVM-1]|nr:hypothetical protein PBCVAP110A_710R [Paramecium bursaria Chlorella virus AP110A]AGE49929.1 hypothetical protein PBCVCan184_731R [Paramecium bursaria Chlorella virus Can18-4]AGE51938.1 hypothetical protein PBCVCVM1_719R [Paramecium bursaria Chlorella virus CVM-1]